MTEVRPGPAAPPVWVTRPQPQAAQLVSVLEQAGFSALAVPTLEIAAPPDTDQVAEQAVAVLPQAYAAVFVSRNAVDWLWRLLGPATASYLADCKVFAVGPGTAAALQAEQITAVQWPEAGADSEALLALPQLAGPEITAQRIVIIRGQGGRALLADTLRSRGAEIVYLEVYRRQPHPGTAQRLTALWHEQPPAAIIASSPAGLRTLLDMTAAEDRPRLLVTPLLCMGRQLTEQARGHGFEECIPVAPAGGEQAVINALRARLTRQEL